MNLVIEKIVLFFDEYGLDNAKRFEFVQVLIERLWMLVGYMSEEAERGNVDFQRNIEEGHMKLYEDDIDYLLKNKERITKMIINTRC